MSLVPFRFPLCLGFVTPTLRNSFGGRALDIQVKRIQIISMSELGKMICVYILSKLNSMQLYIQHNFLRLILILVKCATIPIEQHPLCKELLKLDYQIEMCFIQNIYQIHLYFSVFTLLLWKDLNSLIFLVLTGKMDDIKKYISWLQRNGMWSENDKMIL